MLWFGFAWLFIAVFRWIEQSLHQRQLQLSALPLATMLALLSAWVASPTDYLQAPTFDKKTVTHFQKLKPLVPASDAAIATWWDYGYMSMLINGKPTLHDGGSQTSPTTHFIANNLLRQSQEKAALELKMLGNKGYQGVVAYRQSAETNGHNSSPIRTSVYLVLTQGMTRWMPSISKIGSFDIKAGKPINLMGSNRGISYFMMI